MLAAFKFEKNQQKRESEHHVHVQNLETRSVRNESNTAHGDSNLGEFEGELGSEHNHAIRENKVSLMDVAHHDPEVSALGTRARYVARRHHSHSI